MDRHTYEMGLIGNCSYQALIDTKANVQWLCWPKFDSSFVFGGLLDKEKGEASFLPKIGAKHLAAMPYEIVVEGNKATILHGRFRFAMYWPELTMGQFSKIMSTPGDIEDTMKALTE